MATRETIAYSIQFKELDGKVKPWKQYAERLGHVLDANNIMDVEKKKAHLLSYIGLITCLLPTNEETGRIGNQFCGRTRTPGTT